MEVIAVSVSPVGRILQNPVPASAGCPKQGFQYNFICVLRAGYDVLGVV